MMAIFVLETLGELLSIRAIAILSAPPIMFFFQTDHSSEVRSHYIEN
jgi:hypothetical protein